MKYLLVIIGICFGSLLPLQARTFVLIIGISNYGKEELNLQQSTKDAKSFQEIMGTQTKDIIYISGRNATKENILKKLEMISSAAKAADEIILFYSGHGYDGGMLTYGPGFLNYSEVISALKSSPAHAKIAFIDACHSGAFTQDFKNKIHENQDLTPTDWAIFTSSRANETSKESNYVGAGFFTQALVKGLRGFADSDKDYNITLIELFKYIYQDLVKRSKDEQHPQLLASPKIYDTVLAHWNKN